MAQESESLGNVSRNYIEAGSYYKLAMEMYQSSRFDNATVLAEKARAIYSGMGDIKNVERCDFIITSVKDKRREELMNYAVLAVPIILVVLFIVLRARKAKKKEAV